MIATEANLSWLVGVQKSLLTAAHSHMNNMAITLIIFGLTLNQIRGFISERVIKIVCTLNLISIPLFGIGMLFEAFYPPVAGSLSAFTAIVALGAIFYMITLAIWSSFFILAYLKSK